MFVLVRKDAREQAVLQSTPYDLWRDYDGGVALEFHRTDDGFYLRFPDRADFAIDLATRRVELRPAPDEDPAAAADLFENQVAPLLNAWEGVLVLHASAVAVDGTVIGFMGGSGRGKSTMATAFARRGFPFLTDDGLAVEAAPDRYLARASLDSVRLLPDSRSILLDRGRREDGPQAERKVRIRDPRQLPHQSEPAPLRAIFALGEPAAGNLRVERLQATDAVDALMRHSFMLDTTDKVRMRAHFQRVAAFAESVPCVALDYPRDFAQLDFVVETIIGYVRTLPSPLPDTRSQCHPN